LLGEVIELLLETLDEFKAAAVAHQGLDEAALTHEHIRGILATLADRLK
jgi:hypothetical protein